MEPPHGAFVYHGVALLYRVIYFEHCLREAGVHSIATVSVLRPPGAERLTRELCDEIHDVLPAARIHEMSPQEPPAPCGLLIVIFADDHRFPLHDVIYERLDVFASLLPHAQQARYVMLYRASWRAAEIVPAARLRARGRWLKIERRLIRLLNRSPVVRRLLRPQYGQGN